MNVATDDPRVDALILDSIRSRLMVPMANRIELDGYPFGQASSMAIALGAWLRTGVNVFGDDPITAVDDLGVRPLLILSAGRDDTDSRL